MTDINFCRFGLFFALLLPYQLRKSKHEKKKKIIRDITLHMCTINETHMMYGS